MNVNRTSPAPSYRVLDDLQLPRSLEDRRPHGLRAVDSRTTSDVGRTRRVGGRPCDTVAIETFARRATSLEIAVDTRELHFFDPGTGDGISS